MARRVESGARSESKSVKISPTPTSFTCGGVWLSVGWCAERSSVAGFDSPATELQGEGRGAVRSE